jgi:hypothetical protein
MYIVVCCNLVCSCVCVCGNFVVVWSFFLSVQYVEGKEIIRTNNSKLKKLPHYHCHGQNVLVVSISNNGHFYNLVQQIGI